MFDETWEITDAIQRPDITRRTPPLTPAIDRAAGTDPASREVSVSTTPDICAGTGEFGGRLWQTAHGDGAWAGAIGIKSVSSEAFSVDVSTAAVVSLESVDRFVQQCAHYSASLGSNVVEVTITATDSELLRWGLDDVRLFTTTAKGRGAEATFSTLTAIGTVASTRVTAQFTTAGTIDGPAINIVGNWWHIVATKASSSH
ncbi:hypothetical protein [Nocardia sp. NPDC052566]|uniref:hypothetical protein n=1 Tax=Nocardia sp. NPDC052566 TaxID=3364330 RepID=UPI0037C8F8EB